MAFPRFLTFVAAAGFAATVVASTPAAMATEDSFKPNALKIVVDRAKVVRIAKEADTVIVGNPAIVDATVQDARTLVLTGRSFGVTNLIVLDNNGDPIVDETVVVSGHETNTVRVYRRAVRETLACSPICEPTLTIGDDRFAFSNTSRQINTRNRLSESSAGRR